MSLDYISFLRIDGEKHRPSDRNNKDLESDSLAAVTYLICKAWVSYLNLGFDFLPIKYG